MLSSAVTLRAAVRPDEPLSAHTALRTGGQCGVWVVAHNVGALVEVVADCRSVSWPIRMLGAGTRVVARDGAHRGAVVRLGTGFSTIDIEDGWVVGGAVPVPALVAAAEQAGLGGLTELANVPGTVAASVCFDGGWADVVQEVRVLRRGRERSIPLADLSVGRAIVTGVRLSLPSLDASGRRALARARGKQLPVPPGSAYASVRRGALRDVLRSAALRRVRLRGIAIPDRAPELLVNVGGGLASDLKLLQRSAIERVRKVRGLELEDRLIWIGSK
ncbi:MAG: UDP-N-acetylenolpyruvoylglucosamine reductase [Myxococcota bacterium]